MEDGGCVCLLTHSGALLLDLLHHEQAGVQETVDTVHKAAFLAT